MTMRQDILHYRNILSQCGFFDGLDGEALSRALDGLRARLAHFEKGQTIYRPGDTVRDSAILLEGMVMVETNDAEGEKTALNLMRVGDEFGAYLAVSGNKRSPMRVWAGSDCVILMLEISALRQMDRTSDITWTLYDNLLKVIAGRCVDLYNRVQIYGKKRIRSRIRMYLMSLEARDREVELPVNRTALAAYLGVDRTALARELTRMQEEGIISVSKRRVRLLNPDFFQPAGHDGGER